MKIIIDNILQILNPTDEIKKYCKEELEIDNPQFLQNQRLGFSTYKIPRKLCWYEKRGSDIIVPFGCLKKIYALHPHKEDYEIIIPKAKKVIYKSNIELFDYQKEAKDKAIKAKNGVIVMPARSRKDTNSITINC